MIHFYLLLTYAIAIGYNILCIQLCLYPYNCLISFFCTAQIDTFSFNITISRNLSILLADSVLQACLKIAALLFALNISLKD